MGKFDLARVDHEALHAAARGYDAVAETVDAIVRTSLNRPMFDGAVAGRLHVAHGNAVRDALDDITLAMRQWVTSADDIAHVLRACADRYGVADSYAASRVGG